MTDCEEEGRRKKLGWWWEVVCLSHQELASFARGLACLQRAQKRRRWAAKTQKSKRVLRSSGSRAERDPRPCIASRLQASCFFLLSFIFHFLLAVAEVAEEGDLSIVCYFVTVTNNAVGCKKYPPPPQKKKIHKSSSGLQTVKLYEAYVGRQDGECEGDDDAERGSRSQEPSRMDILVLPVPFCDSLARCKEEILVFRSIIL